MGKEQYIRIISMSEGSKPGFIESTAIQFGAFYDSELIRKMNLFQVDYRTFKIQHLESLENKRDASCEKLLIETVEKEAFARGGRHLLAMCSDSQLDWIQFYETLGYQRVMDDHSNLSMKSIILLEKCVAHLVDLVSPETLSRQMAVVPCDGLPEGAFEVVLLYHPVEVDKESNTGHVVQRRLPNHTHELIWHRHTIEAQLLRLSSDHELVLLFPSQKAIPVSHFRKLNLEHSLIEKKDAAECSKSLRLLVIDSTWQQATKIMAQSPSLRALPHVTLEHVPKSQYVLRKNQKSEGLCTLEAIAEAIEELGYPEGKIHLMDGFNEWLAKGIARYGIKY